MWVRDLPLFLPLLYRDLKRGTQNGFPEGAWAVQEEQHSFSHRCFLLPPQTSHEMMMQCVSRVVSHPLHGESCPLAGSPLHTGNHPKPCSLKGMIHMILLYQMRLMLVFAFRH